MLFISLIREDINGEKKFYYQMNSTAGYNLINRMFRFTTWAFLVQSTSPE